MFKSQATKALACLLALSLVHPLNISTAQARETKAKVYFISPKNNATVKSPFKVKFGVKGIKIRPAGEAPEEKTSGHHHLIVDGKPIAENEPIPSNETHIHYGQGQTEANLTLEPGKHTLTLQFGDGLHLSYGEKLSSTIKIKVK